MSDKFFGGIKAGSTSVSIDVLLRKKADNTELTAIAFGTTGNIASYHRQGAARVAITLATQTVTGAYSSGGWVEIDATNEPGLYRLDVPDAAFASGVDFVTITMVTTSGYAFNQTYALSSDVIQTGDSFTGMTTLLARIPTFPTNFSALSISAGGLVDILQTAADKVWSTASRTLSAFGFNVTLADGSLTTIKFAVGAIDNTVLSSNAEQAIADKTLATAVDGTITLKQAHQLAMAALAGKISGANTTTVTIRDVNDTRNCIVATVDPNGNRSALTLTVV